MLPNLHVNYSDGSSYRRCQCLPIAAIASIYYAIKATPCWCHIHQISCLSRTSFSNNFAGIVKILLIQYCSPIEHCASAVFIRNLTTENRYFMYYMYTCRHFCKYLRMFLDRSVGFLSPPPSHDIHILWKLSAEIDRSPPNISSTQQPSIGGCARERSGRMAN